MTFEFTKEMAALSNRLWAITSAVGAGLCFLVLTAIAAVWTHPKSRARLDRVSFRVVCYALCANMTFGIANSVGGVLSGPSFGCGFSVFILQLTLHFSSFLLCCVAVNLFLVIVYRVSGQRMEKFYIIGSFVLSLVITIAPYAAGQYGWDLLEKDCWYTNDNRTQRLAWQIATQMIWSALTVVVEVAASVSVLAFLLRHRVRQTGAECLVWRFEHRDKLGSSMGTATRPQVILASSCKKIIFRIALYPMASCFVNLMTVFISIHNTATTGINSRADYNILLLGDLWYGGRAIAYAVLAATDPSLVKGIRVLFFHLRNGSDARYESTMSKTRADIGYPKFEVNVELSVVHERSPQEADSSKEASAQFISGDKPEAMDDRQSLSLSIETEKSRDFDTSVSSADNHTSVNGQWRDTSAPHVRPNSYRFSIGEHAHLRLHDVKKEEENAFQRQL